MSEVAVEIIMPEPAAQSPQSFGLSSGVFYPDHVAGNPVIYIGRAASTSSAPPRVTQDKWSAIDSAPCQLTPVERVALRATELSSIVHEIKNKSGLTWDQFGQLMGATRQAVYNWSLGHQTKKQNRQKLSDLLATIRVIDTGSAEQNFAILMSELNHESAFNHVKSGRHDIVRRAFASGSEWQSPKATHLNEPRTLDRQLKVLENIGEVELPRDKPIRKLGIRMG